jgi:hypothetical protein
VTPPGSLRRLRAIPLALGFASLLAALAGGLARLPSPVPAPAAAVAWHGPLMVAGFLGTLIGVERAVAFGAAWGWAAPLGTGLGALAVLATGGAWPARAAIAAGAGCLLAILAAGFARRPTPWGGVQALGAAAFAAACAGWAAGASVPSLVPAFAAFLVLTIAGERLELSRVAAPPTWAKAAFGACLVLLVGGVALAPAAPLAGARLQGAAWLALAAWLARFDLARRNLRRPGLPRFMAATLLAGFGWLGVAGLLALRFGAPPAGLHYDAILHALFVGFVFSMVFAHAPVIFPAVLGAPIGFQPRFYAHAVLLHAGLALRIAGDLAASGTWRRLGGELGALAIALFLVSTAAAAAAGLRRSERRGAGGAAAA